MLYEALDDSPDDMYLDWFQGQIYWSYTMWPVVGLCAFTPPKTPRFLLSTLPYLLSSPTVFSLYLYCSVPLFRSAPDANYKGDHLFVKVVSLL